jgi:hypothetical protein
MVVHLNSEGIATEILNENVPNFPLNKRYSALYLKECVQVDVDLLNAGTILGKKYDGSEFVALPPPEQSPPTEEEINVARIADLERELNETAALMLDYADGKIDLDEYNEVKERREIIKEVLKEVKK